MADFCAQCTEEFLGVDRTKNDFKGVCDPGWFALEICEGCGPIQVDHEGNCVSEDCFRNGHKRNQNV